ncbi:hypothetical protein MNBD_BACTEROID01-11 [hydrothermal vent metagenome]|uniref:Tetratricopeptide repeat protein n=1 Tax=hydrothermal vent metagenome TaxID=652676 RepID=A0A3B0THW0_9ZZZZ
MPLLLTGKMDEKDLYRYINDPGLLSMETLEGLKNLTMEFPFFQTAWLLYLKNLKVVGHKEFESELQKAAIFIADRKKLYSYLYPEGKGKLFHETGTRDYSLDDGSPESPGTGKIKNSLIDSFIRLQPSINLNHDRGEVTPNTDIAEKSISENDEIITETLANILLQQKKYDKAIEAFEKLSLKFPEKSSYFASRIDKVSELKNNLPQ